MIISRNVSLAWLCCVEKNIAVCSEDDVRHKCFRAINPQCRCPNTSYQPDIAAKKEKYIRDDGGYLIMSDGSNIDVSRSRKEILLKKLQPDQD